MYLFFLRERCSDFERTPWLEPGMWSTAALLVGKTNHAATFNTYWLHSYKFSEILTKLMMFMKEETGADDSLHCEMSRKLP